jgi:hypothetical protein
MKTLELSSTYLWDILDALDHYDGQTAKNELILWNEAAMAMGCKWK